MTIEQAEGRIKELEDALADILEIWENDIYGNVECEGFDEFNAMCEAAEDILYRGVAYAEEA